MTTGTIYGTALNYKGALVALGEAVNGAPYNSPPKAPVLYIKPANTLNEHGKPIPLPKGVLELEVGACLGVVMNRTTTKVSEEEALQFVEGYIVVNDVSIPHESLYRPAIKQKARDGFCPISSQMIQQEAVTNPDSLGVRVWINGELRQENTTANLVRSISRLLADVTEFMTLYSGDILLVGVPEQPPLAKAGDRIRIEIDEVGFLENTVVPEEECR
ncbi:fumarylacetoacetate hydrolase family protein [Bacillus sp. REN10]|uniref:fumarylacetoacetate hydrolase family protein n=1 Tax=Bacillus sp. REN10 TaxID=2782541 RepID=UPI00193B8979|nr:fumarylacetoacetate hydrolase family protein [Bacillus sp. REN10]